MLLITERNPRFQNIVPAANARVSLNSFCATCRKQYSFPKQTKSFFQELSWHGFVSLRFLSFSKVKFGIGTSDDEKISDVHVGSPRYIREVYSQDAIQRSGLNPAIRRLLTADEPEVEIAEAEGIDGVSDLLSVRVRAQKLG